MISKEEMKVIESIREGTFNYRLSKIHFDDMWKNILLKDKYIIFVDNDEEQPIFNGLISKGIVIINKGDSFISIDEIKLNLYIRSSNIDKILEN